MITAVVLLISGLTHTLLGRWLLDVFPKLRPHRRIVIGVLVGCVVLGAVARLVTNATHSPIAGSVYAAVMCELIIVLFSALPLVIVRLLARGFEAVAPTPPPNTEQMTRRRAIERVGGVAVVGATGSLVGWGAIIGRHDFVVEEVPVRIVGLPRALDGYTITQISDIHVGMLVGDRELGEGLDKLARAKGDLVVITGDMLDFDPRFIPQAARALATIRARDGVYAILGNHDHYTGAEAVTQGLRAAGIDVLVNDGRLIRAGDGGGFALLGVDDLHGIRNGGAGPRLDRAMSAVPDDRPRILLSHQPQSIDLWAGRVALQLSGHTHGGQFNPGFRPADLVMKYVAGRYEVGMTSLWVNRGFGVVGPPARLGAPPEVTKIVLVSA